MAEAKTAVATKPVWVDLASSDAAASRDFYSKVFGWKVEVTTDPQYGGYAIAKIAGKDVAGIGPKQSAEAPTAWSAYIGTHDAQGLVTKVQNAGGKVIAPPFDVGDQGRMAVFQDPSGAVISVWQPKAMTGFQTSGPNAFAWVELNARGFEKALPFYKTVFGWTDKRYKPDEMGPGAPPYTEFKLGDESIAGGQEMPQVVPADVPSHWLIYFAVDDVDKSFKKATEAGGKDLMAPMDFPGGRFAIVADPQGAAFGILKMAPR